MINEVNEPTPIKTVTETKIYLDNGHIKTQTKEADHLGECITVTTNVGIFDRIWNDRIFELDLAHRMREKMRRDAAEMKVRQMRDRLSNAQISIEIVDAAKQGPGSFEAEKAHIKKMLDKAFSEAGTFLQIGEYQRFRTEIVSSIVYNENKDEKMHQIFVHFIHTDNSECIEIPFGFRSNPAN